MGGFKASFINEIEKMYKKKKAVVIVFISIAVIVFGQLIVSGVRELGIRGASGSEFPLLVLSVFSNTVLPLFTALVSIEMFAGEFSHNTMKINLVRPVSRLKLFLSKVTVVAFFVLLNLLLVMVLSTLTGLIFNTSSVTAAGFVKILVSYLVTAVPMMCLALIIVFLSNIFRNGTAVFFMSFMLFLVFKALGLVFPQYSGILITSILDWHSLWIADVLPFAKLFRQLLIMLGYALMFFTAGYYLFDKKDL